MKTDKTFSEDKIAESIDQCKKAKSIIEYRDKKAKSACKMEQKRQRSFPDLLDHKEDEKITDEKLLMNYKDWLKYNYLKKNLILVKETSMVAKLYLLMERFKIVKFMHDIKHKYTYLSVDNNGRHIREFHINVNDPIYTWKWAILVALAVVGLCYIIYCH